MGRFSDGDPEFLRTDQYRDDRNLAVRIALHERFTTDPLPFHRWLFDRITLPPDVDLLEVGCGSAKLWAENRERVPLGWSITLTDFSSGMLESAADAVGDLPCRFECCDAQSLPFEDHSFDALLANHMLYHVPDRERALCEFTRVLNHDGTLIAATNGRDHLRQLNELVEEHAGAARHDLEFAANFSLETGGALLERHFTSVRVEERPNELRVTEVEPLLAFIRASWSPDEISKDAQARMQEVAERSIAEDGAFRISICAGVFVARGPRSTPRIPPRVATA